MPKDEGSPDLVIVSMHERGFPQADIYVGAATMDPDEFRCCGMSPDGFFTMKRGDSVEAAFAKAQIEYPNAKVVYGVDPDETKGREAASELSRPQLLQYIASLDRRIKSLEHTLSHERRLRAHAEESAQNFREQYESVAAQLDPLFGAAVVSDPPRIACPACGGTGCLKD